MCPFMPWLHMRAWRLQPFLNTRWKGCVFLTVEFHHTMENDTSSHGSFVLSHLVLEVAIQNEIAFRIVPSCLRWWKRCPVSNTRSSFLSLTCHFKIRPESRSYHCLYLEYTCGRGLRASFYTGRSFSSQSTPHPTSTMEIFPSVELKKS